MEIVMPYYLPIMAFLSSPASQKCSQQTGRLAFSLTFRHNATPAIKHIASSKTERDVWERGEGGPGGKGEGGGMLPLISGTSLKVTALNS